VSRWAEFYRSFANPEVANPVTNPPTNGRSPTSDQVNAPAEPHYPAEDCPGSPRGRQVVFTFD
jgi:hypothetical protein